MNLIILPVNLFMEKTLSNMISPFSAKDNYVKGFLSKDGIAPVYKKEDLSQVNPQLYKWLAIINDKSSFIDNSISQSNTDVNIRNLEFY